MLSSETFSRPTTEHILDTYLEEQWKHKLMGYYYKRTPEVADVDVSSKAESKFTII